MAHLEADLLLQTIATDCWSRDAPLAIYVKSGYNGDQLVASNVPVPMPHQDREGNRYGHNARLGRWPWTDTTLLLGRPGVKQSCKVVRMTPPNSVTVQKRASTRKVGVAAFPSCLGSRNA